jgi:hypothetical protein
LLLVITLNKRYDKECKSETQGKKSASNLKTLKVGNCVLPFTVQEPQPKGSKLPTSTRTVKNGVIW